tara:strand:- start:13 stop:228 length:216 start_codon:yes stop_codon:yes gene_type:complete
MVVKKTAKDTSLFETDQRIDKNISEDKVKTTNVNILLNRVRLDKKRTLKKKIIYSLIVISIISTLSIYLIL